jgi:hypothetical protein
VQEHRVAVARGTSPASTMKREAVGGGVHHGSRCRCTAGQSSAGASWGRCSWLAAAPRRMPTAPRSRSAGIVVALAVGGRCPSSAPRRPTTDTPGAPRSSHDALPCS